MATPPRVGVSASDPSLLGDAELVVYRWLLSTWDGGSPAPSRRRLARELGMSPSGVGRIVDGLVACGLVEGCPSASRKAIGSGPRPGEPTTEEIAAACYGLRPRPTAAPPPRHARPVPATCRDRCRVYRHRWRRMGAKVVARADGLCVGP